MKKTKVIINLIVIILIWLGIFASGLWYGTKVYGDYVEELQQEQELLKREVQAFTKVSDPKTIRLYVKELNKILDDITFLGKIVESGQVSSESLDSYFNEYEVKLENVKGRIKRLYSELTELDSKFKQQVTRLTTETDDNLELIDAIKEEDIKRLAESDEQFMKIVKDLDSIKVMINDLKNSKIDKFWKPK